MHVGIFPCSRHALAGRVLTVPLEGFTQGQGFEPKKAGFERNGIAVHRCHLHHLRK